MKELNKKNKTSQRINKTWSKVERAIPGNVIVLFNEDSKSLQVLTDKIKYFNLKQEWGI